MVPPQGHRNHRPLRTNRPPHTDHRPRTGHRHGAPPEEAYHPGALHHRLEVHKATQEAGILRPHIGPLQARSRHRKDLPLVKVGSRVVQNPVGASQGVPPKSKENKLTG